MAGLVYLVVVAAGIFSLAYVPQQLSIEGAPSRELEIVTRGEDLLRFGIAAEIVCQIAFLILPLALCRVLWDVDRNSAILMTALVTAGVPLAFANMSHHFEVLRIIAGSGAPGLSPEQAGAAITSARAAYIDGLRLLYVFWGLWLIPLGYLVIRSGFLPAILGALLMLRGADYLFDVFGDLLLKDYSASLVNRLLGVSRLAEIFFCAWLLVFGARRWRISFARKRSSRQEASS